MTPVPPESELTSLFALGTTLIQNRRRIVRWAFVGAIVTGLSVISRPQLYRSSVSFVPQGSGDAGQSGLPSLAGQFGVQLPGLNQSLSPDFYASLLKSRVLLSKIARDTITVMEEGNRRAAFLDLFRVKDANAARREALGARLLTDLEEPSVVKTTGVVQVSVQTRWPSVSLAIVTALVNGVNEFDQRTRQSQAAAERSFLEGRLSMANSDLRSAEDRLAEFLRTNRQFSNSADLTFERDRLQRVVTLRQLVVTSLTQAYEDARIREVRDTPVITIVDPPVLPSLAEPRGRIRSAMLGFFLGGIVGVFLVFVGRVTAHARNARSVDVEQFFAVLDNLRGALLRPFRRKGQSS